jgi:subtilisin family serine protease
MSLRQATIYLLAAAFAAVSSGAAIGAASYAEGYILVKPAAGLNEERFARILKRAGGRSMGRLHGLEVRKVAVPPQAERKVAAALSRSPLMAFAELDQLVEPIATPDDPGFSKQWHLPVMQAPDAWSYGDGSSVTVAVLDTGVYSAHPDLAGKVVAGWNTVSNNTDTADINNHGTWVAGVIGEYANNGIGGASVAPGSSIMPVRISNRSDGAAYFSDMAEGVAWADAHGARVANISYHGVAGSKTVETAAANMMAHGGVVVVAAGNNNTDEGYANSDYLYVAAATTSGDTRATFSNYGDYVDISAPGVSIYTTARNGGYSSVSGTSFSSPATAATAAVVMSANPGLTPSDVLAVISNTATDLGTAGWDPYYGFGRVNTKAAAVLAANATTSDTVAPQVSVAAPADGGEVSDWVTIDIQASDDFGVVSTALFVDGRKVATETQAVSPDLYRFAWDSTSVSDGSHVIYATASDAAGNVGTSTNINLNVANNAPTDTVPPTITITSPTDGATVSGSVSLSAFATDDQQMAWLRIFADGVLKCSGTSNASCSWNTRKLDAGSHQVSVQAADASGNTASAGVTVQIVAGKGGGGKGGGGTGGNGGGKGHKTR